MKKGFLALGAVTVLLMTACVPNVNITDDSIIQSSSSSIDTVYEPESNVVRLHIGDKHRVVEDAGEIEFTYNGMYASGEVRCMHWFDDYINLSISPGTKCLPDKSRETYLSCRLTIKNIGDYTVSPDFIHNIALLFDDKNKFFPDKVYIDSGYWSFLPSESKDVWLVASIPDEIINKDFILSFYIGETTCKIYSQDSGIMIDDEIIRPEIMAKIDRLVLAHCESLEFEKRYRNYLNSHGGINNLSVQQKVEAMDLLKKSLDDQDEVVAILEESKSWNDLNGKESEYFTQAMKQIS